MFGVLTKRNSRPCENPENQPIADMLDDRAEELGRNQRMALVFRKASSSVRKYPLPIRSGKDARKLSYIGEKLALEIQRFLSTRITSTPTQRSRREISRTESAPVSSRLSFSSPAVPERPKILPGKFRLFKGSFYLYNKVNSIFTITPPQPRNLCVFFFLFFFTHCVKYHNHLANFHANMIS